MTKAEEILIDIEFTLDMYSAGADGAENALEKVREILKPVVSLADDQQVVLEQLRQIFIKQSYKSKMQAIYIFIKNGMSEEFLRLDREESNQVLAAFAEWGSKEDNQ